MRTDEPQDSRSSPGRSCLLRSHAGTSVGIPFSGYTEILCSRSMSYHIFTLTTDTHFLSKTIFEFIRSIAARNSPQSFVAAPSLGCSFILRRVKGPAASC